MVQFLIGLGLALAGIGLLFVGVTGPLTPPEGLPPVQDMAVFGALPVVLIGFATALTKWRLIKSIYTLLMIAAILLLVYLGLALIQ